jgi:hypothetical protein
MFLILDNKIIVQNNDNNVFHYICYEYVCIYVYIYMYVCVCIYIDVR